MSNHSFDIHVATEYKSMEIATLVWHFQYWIMKNKRLNRNFIEGRTWTYQTNLEIASVFPYWSIYQVERLITKAVKLKILIKGNYNKSQFDRTVWYAFENEEKFGISRFHEMESGESGNGDLGIAEPIPDTLPYTLPNRDIGAQAPLPTLRSKKEKVFLREFVKVTPEQAAQLKTEMSELQLNTELDILNAYIGAHGDKYKSHYHTLIKGGWVWKAYHEELSKEKPKQANTSPPAMGNDEESLRGWWKVVKNNFKRPNMEETFHDGYEYIQFRNDNGDGEKIYFKNVNFKDLVKREISGRKYVRTNP